MLSKMNDFTVVYLFVQVPCVPEVYFRIQPCLLVMITLLYNVSRTG